MSGYCNLPFFCGCKLLTAFRQNVLTVMGRFRNIVYLCASNYTRLAHLPGAILALIVYLHLSLLFVTSGRSRRKRRGTWWWKKEGIAKDCMVVCNIVYKYVLEEHFPV